MVMLACLAFRAATGGARVVTGRGGTVAAAPTAGTSSGATRVFVVADVELYAQSLAVALGSRDDVRVVGTSACRLDVARPIADAAPDVVIVDVGCAEALALIDELVAGHAPPGVIAIAAPETEDEVVACIEAGVSAFVPLDGSFADLVATLARVGRGESVVSPRIATTLIRRVRELADSNAGEAGQALTQRELEILVLIDRGLSNKEIAGALSIEVSTVKNHVHHILGKLDVSRRTDAPGKLWPVRAPAPGTRSLSARGSRSP